MLELGGLLLLLALGVGLIVLAFKLLLWLVLLPLRLLGLILAAVGSVLAVLIKGSLLFVAAIAAIAAMVLVAIPLIPVLVAGLLVAALFRSLRRRPTYAAAR